ncbi:MAG: hypothetical protein WKF67_11140 [Rubrobacteraceae bacterium]
MDRRVPARLVLLALLCAGLVACGQSGSGESREDAGDAPAEPKTSRPSEEQAPSTPRASEPPAPQTVIGETLPPENFDLRVLEVAVFDEYFYLESTYSDQTVQSIQGFPTAGKFVVVTYSVRNTGAGPLNVGFSGTLSTEGGESYEESGDVFHPNALLDGSSGGFELQPRGLELGQFIFDVPADVDPATLAAGYTNLGDSSASAAGDSQAGDVDLTRRSEPGAPPEEVLALQFEYANMQAFDLAYDLFAEQSEGLISEGRYTEVQEQGDLAITQYSFPSVQTQEDRATIERLFTTSEEGETFQDKATQEAILEDGAWGIVMRDDQAEYYNTFQGEETTG